VRVCVCVCVCVCVMVCQSKVGDNAIDIPCANVVIQISFNFASR